MNHLEYERLQQVAELGDRFLSYVDQGQGHPLVLLHGFPTWGFLWHRLAPSLARSHRVLVPDLLGYGRSDRSDRFARSLSRQAEILLRWLDAMGVERAAFVGHEIGGAIALRIALERPDRVSAIGLLGSVWGDDWPAAPYLPLGSPSAPRRLSAQDLLEQLRPTLAGGFLIDAPGELLDGLLAPYATEVGKTSLLRDAAALDPSETLELEPYLSRLRAPALLLWGAEDPFCPVVLGERLRDGLPSAQLVRLEASHFLMWDQPREVEERLRAHLDAAGLGPRTPAPVVNAGPASPA